jgi:hypothetical protein
VDPDVYAMLSAKIRDAFMELLAERTKTPTLTTLSIQKRREEGKRKREYEGIEHMCRDISYAHFYVTLARKEDNVIHFFKSVFLSF